MIGCSLPCPPHALHIQAGSLYPPPKSPCPSQLMSKGGRTAAASQVQVRGVGSDVHADSYNARGEKSSVCSFERGAAMRHIRFSKRTSGRNAARARVIANHDMCTVSAPQVETTVAVSGRLQTLKGCGSAFPRMPSSTSILRSISCNKTHFSLKSDVAFRLYFRHWSRRFFRNGNPLLGCARCF